ncbi:MAG: CHAT domain-containing protein [Cyanobacteria bacterium J06635_15]
MSSACQYSLLSSMLTSGAIVIGLTLPASADLPSQADRNNVTNQFDYQYVDPSGAGSGNYRSQVLSNRWVYWSYSADGANFEAFADCATQEWHFVTTESGEGSYTLTYASDTVTYTLDGVTETIPLPPEVVAEYSRSLSEICQTAQLNDTSSEEVVVTEPETPPPETSPLDLPPAAPVYETTTPGGALSGLGFFFVEASNFELATTFFKGAVETYEQARLDPTVENPPRSEVEPTYRALAETLLEQGRVAEALEVVDSFRVWEAANYLSISDPVAEMRVAHQSRPQQYASASLKANSVQVADARTQDQGATAIIAIGLGDIIPDIDLPNVPGGVDEAVEAEIEDWLEGENDDRNETNETGERGNPSQRDETVPASTRGANQPVTLLQAEQEILEAHQESLADAIAIGRELAELRAIPPDQRTQQQADRIAELVARQAAINREFNDFIDSPEVQARLDELSDRSRRQSLNPDDLNALRDDLKELNAAIIYPLILEDRLELIITTPQSPPIRHTVSVGRSELHRTIQTFRSDLDDPNSNPQPTAQQLYQWLIAPLANDLETAGITTILYAPDGQLRYIPLAALHDGDQWLAERYPINTITARSLHDLDAQTSRQPAIFAAAFTNTDLAYSVEIGNQTTQLRGLPFAGREVALLTGDRPNHTLLLDQAFSLEAVSPRMDDHTIVHFATHAAFVPGDPTRSFILFGNGETPTLADVRNWSLSNVDLVVLSACETGVGGVLADGTEILGLGYQFQRAGARATIASLWQVSDGGTQVLMNAFYTALDQGMSKTEALRWAQIALINGDETVFSDQRAGIEIRFEGGRSASEARDTLGHPYYWAPFILIGNGL